MSVTFSRTVKVVARWFCESVVTKTVLSCWLSVVKTLSSVWFNPWGSSGTTKTRERSINGAEKIVRNSPNFSENFMHVVGVKRRPRKTDMTFGFSMYNAREETENETMRGDVPAQEDGSGSKTTPGQATVPEGVTFPNPTLKEAKILCVA